MRRSTLVTKREAEALTVKKINQAFHSEMRHGRRSVPGTTTLSLIGMILALWFCTPVYGGGFEIADQGGEVAGRAGASTAKVDDVTAIEYNPAGLTKIQGTQFYIGNRFTYSNEEFRRARTLDWSDAVHGIPKLESFDTARNQTPFQILGTMFGAASNFGLKDWAFAVGVYGPSGTASQKFDAEGPQRYQLIKRDVLILYYNFSLAWKYNDLFGIGASLQWVDLNKMEFELAIDGNVTPGIVNPVSSDFDMRIRIKGADHVGFSGILGFWVRPLPCLELAVSSRLIPVRMNAKSKLSVTPFELDPTQAKATITKNGKPDNNVTFSMNLPIKLRAGLRYIYMEGDKERFDLELDFGYESWSMMKNYTLNGGGRMVSVLGNELSIDKIVIDKNWKDTYSLRLGGDVSVVPGWFALRGGFFYESPSAAKEYSYVDFFSSHRFGPSVGFSVDFFGVNISAAYTYTFQMPVVVTEEKSKVYQQTPGSLCKEPYTDASVCSEYYLGRPGAPVNAGTYTSDYHFVTANVSYTF